LLTGRPALSAADVLYTTSSRKKKGIWQEGGLGPRTVRRLYGLVGVREHRAGGWAARP
jgi:hypothetical protein